MQLKRKTDQIHQLENSSFGSTPEGQKALQRLKAERDLIAIKLKYDGRARDIIESIGR